MSKPKPLSTKWAPLGVLAILLIPALSRAALSPGDNAFFEKNIRPLLVEHCYQCHSSQADKVKGGLLLDSQEGWMNGGDSGEVLQPGSPGTSLLLKAVRYEDPDLQMPPKYKLADREIDLLEQWIRRGAPDPRTGSPAPAADASLDLEAARSFWAFQAPRETDPPSVQQTDWPADSLDRFVLAQLEEEGLQPVEDADRRTLLRRVTFDLTGLPPGEEEIQAFLQDPAPDREALATVVDRLLDSPHFGERWGRHWLDVVRYAESMGRTRNWPFPFAWRYRDYVIEAFNQDKPYDQFILEQLAGDLLPFDSDEERNEQHIATGFLALGSQDLNERDQAQFTMDVVDEQIDVTGRALLALTTGCARCHDHKFDPIPTADYYALAGIFKSTEVMSGYSNRRGGNQNYFDEDRLIKLAGAPEGPALARPGEDESDNRARNRRQRQIQNQIDKLNEQADRIIAQARQQAQAQRRSNPDKARAIGEDARQEVADLKRQVRRLEQQKKNASGPRRVTASHFAMGVAEGEPEACRINVRGDAHNLGPRVERGFLQVLTHQETPDINPQASGRLELARWIASPSHPLTARVMVNRVWHHLFGRGLVATVDNFGVTGERPTHPELLDHLALRFVEQDWSVKSLIRDLVLSRTYRLSSRHDAANYARDPDNLRRWRMDMRRLEAEALRDAILAASGRLDPEPPGGSPVMEMNLGEIGRRGGSPDLAQSRHRSVYLPVLRNYLPDVFEAFDFAEPSSVMGRRDVTTVSTQALFLMNNEFVLEQAEAMAVLLHRQAPDSEAGRVRRAYRRTLGRDPSPEEIQTALAFITRLSETSSHNPRAALAAFCQALFAGAEFRYLQ